MTSMQGGATDPEVDFEDHVKLECQICWTPYDPVVGDSLGRIAPGTPFANLPADWACPGCNAPKANFVRPARHTDSMIAAAVAALEAGFDDLLRSKMRSSPLTNSALRVEAVGYRRHENRPVGILVTPWFMSIIVLPGEDEDWSDLAPGTKEYLSFETGDYEFLHNLRDGIGGYKACCLFSPMHEFASHTQACEVAKAVLRALFDAQDAADDVPQSRPADDGVINPELRSVAENVSARIAGSR